MRRAASAVVRVLSVIAATIPFTSCYLLNQGAALFRYQAAAEPLGEILDRGTLADGRELVPRTREFLNEVERVREFAVSLGLQASDNYSTFVATERTHLVDVVSATGQLSFERREWWWPFVGRLPYKGYYDPEDADRLADRLRDRGHDVWVRPVSAFSTLGVFSDPLYEFMARYDRHTIANLIIHENAHATLFLRGHAQFNEEFATFVGDTGADEYLRAIGAPEEELQLVVDRAADRSTSRRLILDLRAQLEAIYSTDLPDEEKLQAKKDAIAGFQEFVRGTYDSLFRTDSFRSLSELPINNAFIDLYVAYTEDLELFEDLFAVSGRSLPEFIDRISVLARPREIGDRTLRRLARRDPKEYIRQVLLGE